MDDREFAQRLMDRGYDVYWNEQSRIVMAILDPLTQSREKLAEDVKAIGWNRSYGSDYLPFPDGTYPDDWDERIHRAQEDTVKPKPEAKRKAAPPRAPDRDSGNAAKTQRKTRKRCQNAAETGDDDQLPGQMSFFDIWPGGGYSSE